MHSRDGRIGAGASTVDERSTSLVAVDGTGPVRSLLDGLEGDPALSLARSSDAGGVIDTLRSSTDRPTCVLAPFEAGELSGVALFERVREHSEVPVVLVDEAPTPARASRALAAGVDDYVPLGGDDDAGTVAVRCRRLAARHRESGHLAARDRHLETLLDDLPGMVYRCRNDRDWTMEFVSNGAGDLTGYDPATLTGDDLSYGRDVVHPDDRDAVWSAVQEALAAREPFRIDYRIVRADDEVRWVWEQGRGLFESGDVDALQGFITDVTERREARSELAERNRRLDEFASVVSHDLRNPLNVATGHLDLALERLDDERQDEGHLHQVAAALDRMDELIEDLLVLSRQGTPVGSTEPVHLGGLAEECWVTVETCGATLAVDADRAVLADRSRLRQLLENLFRNAVEHGSTSPRSQAHGDAIDHGPAGDSADEDAAAADLTVSVELLDDASGFAVEDDGVGIPPGDRDDVFEARFSTSVDGTGFGLAIVRDVATAHGWTVRATAGSSGGARFEVTDVEWADELP